MPLGADSGFPVDELDTGFMQSGQLGTKIRDRVGDMVKARAAPFEETGDGAVRSEWLHKLHVTDESDPDPLIGKFLDRGTSIPAQEFVQSSSWSKGSNGHRDVVDRTGRHQRDPRIRVDRLEGAGSCRGPIITRLDAARDGHVRLDKE